MELRDKMPNIANVNSRLNALILVAQMGDPNFNNNKISSMRDCIKHVLFILTKNNAKELIQKEISEYEVAMARSTCNEFDDIRSRVMLQARLGVYQTALAAM
jgi:hypothetical protein